jgi:DNA-binding response OmpR family regulator
LYQIPPAGITALATPRVLIADTDPELRQRLYSRLLEADIFADCVATTGDALQNLEDFPYGVVIADVGLPNGGVERVVEWIARMDPHERPIVLILAPTAEAARTLDVEIVQIVLRRPVDVAQVVDLVRSCLRSSAAGRSRERTDGDGDRQPEVT